VLLCCIHTTALFSQQPLSYQLSTHILDTGKGVPAAQVPVVLYQWNAQQGEWMQVASALTGADGRVGELLPAQQDNDGIYKLRFDTHGYFTSQGLTTIYPYVEVVFEMTGKTHYHIPITMSANGYSTYRGS